MADESKTFLRETPGVTPNSATQTPDEYVAARFGALSPDKRQALGFGENAEMYMHVELMFRSCYWRERHDLLEKNFQIMVRELLAGRAAAFSLVKRFNTDWSDAKIREVCDVQITEEFTKLKDNYTVFPK